MQFGRKGKKTEVNDSSRVDDANNTSNYSGINQDSFSRGRETTGRQMNSIIYPRGEVLERSTTESGFKEVYFYDAGDIRRTQYVNPNFTEGRQTVGTQYIGNRSPVQTGNRQSVLQSVKNNLNIRDDTSNILGSKPIPSLVLNIPSRREYNESVEKFERSPKVISLAGVEQQPEFNTRSFTNQRKIQRETNRPYQGNQYGTGTINIGENTGNILIDQPMNFGQYGDNYITTTQTGQRSPQNTGRILTQGNRDRSLYDRNDIMIDVKDTLRNKMSPNRNSEGDLVIEFNKKTEINDKKAADRIDRNNNYNSEAAENEADRQIQNSYEKESEEPQRGSGVKKYMRHMTRAYVPHKKEGKLITKDHKVISPVNDQLFADRKKVIQKMNKLSHILLSTKENQTPALRSSSADVEDGQARARPSLRDIPDSSRKFAASRSPSNTFFKATMAMISSKGPNCEDREIKRVQRYEVGGVIDLAHNRTAGKKQYEVRKVQRVGLKNRNQPQTKFTHKDRQKASKIIQAWWRDILFKYNNSISKIVKIQTVWRGFFLRDNLYEYLYMLTLLSIFNERIRNSTVLSVFGKFFKTLKHHYLPRVIAIRKAMAAFKIQRQARKFLTVMRNKKIVLPLLIEKLAFKNRVHTFKDVRQYADEHKSNTEKNVAFLEKLKKILRVNIFHDTLFSIFKIPMQRLTNQVIKYVLKKNLNKSDNEVLRQYFMRWFKRTIQLKSRPNVQKTSAKLLVNAITKPHFTELTRAMKNQVPRELKQKIVRRLLGNKEKHRDIWLQIYLRSWKERSKKLAVREFYDATRGKFLAKFNKNLSKRVLGENFRKWRDAWMKSKDLRPFIKGLEHLQRHAKRKAFDQVMPIEYNEGIKSRIVNGLFSKLGIFKKIPLRFYNEKWRKICEKIRKLKISGMFLNSIGTRIFKQTIRKMLFKRFLDWQRKTQMLKYKDLIVTKNSEHQKIFATNKLVQNLKSHGKKVALKTISPELLKYLRDQFYGSIAKRVTSLMPQLEKTRKRMYWRNYRDRVEKIRQKETRNKFFEFFLKNTNSKLSKNYFRHYMLKWRRNLPKNVEVKYYKAAEELNRALLMRNLKYPIDAFEQKIDTDNAKNGIIRSLGIKNKYIHRHWRNYLSKWKKISDGLDKKEKQNELAGKLLSTFAKNIRRRILSNRFSHMRKVPKINMKDVLDRYKNMSNVIFRSVKYSLKPTKKTFLEKFSNHVGPKKFRWALDQLANMAINGNNLKKRSGLEKWRLKTKDSAILALRMKLLGFSVTKEGIKFRKLKLATAFHLWRKYIALRKAVEGTHKNWKLVNFGMVIDKMTNRRQNELMTRLKRLMNLDTRGRIILAMEKRLNRPRNTTGRLFDRWRRINDRSKQELMVQNMNANVIEKTCKTLFRRLLRDKFVKCFGRWKVACRKPNDYYEKKLEGLNLFNNWVKLKGCKQPFNLIADSKNYKKIFDKILPANMKLQQRNRLKSMGRAFIKWKDVKDHYSLMENYGMMVGKLSGTLQKRKQKTRLTSAFYKWKNMKKRTVYLPDVIKAEKFLMNTMQKRWRRPIFDKLKSNLDEKRKKSGIFAFLSTAKSFEKNKVKLYFKKWFKAALLKDDDIKNKTLRSFKRIMLENYLMGPKEKYFRRWLRAMIQKPVDFKKLENAFNVISFGFRKQHSKRPFDLIKNHRASDFLRNAINTKLFPKINSFKLRIMRNTLHKWLRNSKAQTVKNFYAKYLCKVYDATKKSFLNKLTKSKFNQYKFKNKRPELKKVIDGEKIIFGVLARKYFDPGFFSHMKTYGENKFLRGLLFKNSKFHRKALEPFFRRWRYNANRIKDEEMEKKASLQLISRIRNHNFKNNNTDFIRRKFNHYRFVVREYTKKMNRIIPLGDKLLIKGAKKLNYPSILFKLRLNRLRSKQGNSMNNLSKMISNTFLRRQSDALRRWRDVIGVLRMDEVRRNTMGMFLKNYGKRVTRDTLRRGFLKWSGKIIPAPNRRAVAIGVIALTRVFGKPSFKKLFDRTKLMNLKIPFGMSFSEAYLRINPNIAKCAILRNIAVRPRFRRWLKAVEEKKSKDLQLTIFNKIFLPAARKKSSLVLRRALVRWKDVIVKQDLLNLKKGFHSKVLVGMYDRNNKLALRKKFNHWKDINKLYFRNLNDISLGVIKLRNSMNKHGLKAIREKCKLLDNDRNIMEKIKRNIYAVLRNSDKGNLEFCFNKWKKQVIKLRERNLKYRLLKLLVSTQEKKNIINTTNKLHEAVLKWRIKCAPIDMYDRFSKIRLALHSLQTGLNKKFNRFIYDRIKGTASADKVKELLFRFISDYEKSGLTGILRNKLKLWRVRVGDTDILKGRFTKLVDNYVFNSNVAYNELFKKPSDDLVEAMKARVAFKNSKAQSIQDYCRNILNLLHKMTVVKRNLKLSKIFANLSFKDAIKVRIFLARWVKNSNLSEANQKAKVIQRFLRGRQAEIERRRLCFDKGGNFLLNYIKRKTLNDLQNKSVKLRLRQLMFRLMDDLPDDVKREFLKKHTYRWRSINRKMKEDEAADKIKYHIKAYIARKWKDFQLKRKQKLNAVSYRLFKQYLDKKRIYFNQWVIDSRLNRLDTKAKIIQNYLRKNLENVRDKNARLNIFNLFKKSFVNNLTTSIKKASKINSNRALILNETLKNIYFNRPFDKLRTASMWIGRTRLLHRIRPKITNALKKHYLPHYLRKWKTNTYDDMINKMIRVQNWIRTRFLLWRMRTQAKREGLVQKYLFKLTNDNDLLLKIAMKMWIKKAKIDTMHKQATLLQNAWRGNTSKKNAERLLNQKRLSNLLRRGMVHNICDDITKCGEFIRPLKRNLARMNSKIENRYTTNNLLTLANNNIRNLYFKGLNKKLGEKDTKSLLRKYLYRFKVFGIYVNNIVKKIQKGLRFNLLKNNNNKLQRRKDLFMKIYAKFETTDDGKKKIFLRRWLNKATVNKAHFDAETIQRFLRKNFLRIKVQQFQRFFTENAKRLAHRRINNSAKTVNFRSALQKNALRVFNERLNNKTKRDKVVFLFAKRFYSGDEQLKGLYLKTYLRRWNGIANRLKVQENEAAIKITNAVKMFVAKKQLKMLKDQKERVMRILLTLTGDMDLKAKLYWNIWRARSKEDKYSIAAQVLQRFMRRIQKKSLRLKSQRKNKDFEDGLDTVGDTYDNAMKYRFLRRLDAKRNKNLLTKVFDTLVNKKIDHEKTGIDKIHEFGFWKYQNRTSGAQIIQKIYKVYRERKGLWGVISKIRKLRFILGLMGDRNKRILNKACKIWKRNAKTSGWHQNAAAIQGFLRQNILYWRQEKARIAKNNLQRMFKLYANKRIKDPFRLLSMSRKLNILSDSSDSYLRGLGFKKLVQSDKMRIMNKLFRLPKSSAQRITKKWLDIFRKRARALKEKEAALKIQRRLRTHFVVQRKNDVKERIDRILFRLACKNDDIRRFNLNLWNRRVKAIISHENSRIIQKFVRNNFARIMAKKKWHRLSEKLYSRNYLNGGKDAMNRYRQFVRLEKLYGILDGNLKKDGFENLLRRLKDIKIRHRLVLMFQNTDKAIEINTLNFYFRRWRHTTDKYVRRDQALLRLKGIYDDNEKFNAAKTLKEANSVKGLFDLIDVVKNKLAFKKLKTRANNKNKVKRFGDCFVEGDRDLNNKNKNVMVDRIYRIYIYKLLDKALKNLSDYQQSSLKPQFGSILLDKLNNKRLESSNWKYENQFRSKRPANAKTLQFASETIDAKKKAAEIANKDSLKYTVPHLVNFLNNKMRERLRLAIFKLKGDQQAKKFAELFKSHVNKKALPDAFTAIHNRYLYNKQTPILLEKLRRMLRLSFLKTSKKQLNGVAERNRLFYLVKVTLMHREMGRKRAMGEGFRRWRFLAFMKKIAKRKMEVMYKGMHMNYLKMAMEVFGDDDSNPGLIREIESFSNTMGMFTNENMTAYEEFKKRFAKGSTKRYVFPAFEIIKDNEESHFDDGDVNNTSDYYYQEGLGDSTQGRYKTDKDTNKSSYKSSPYKKTSPYKK